MGITPSETGPPTIEAALRYLGTRDHGDLVDLLEHAIDRPQSATGAALAPLMAPTAVLEGWTAAERAHALWQVIRKGVRDPDVGPTVLSRRRRAMQAAFRLPDPDIHEPWGSSLTERFKQLKSLTEVFGRPTSTQPMEMAWKRGVRALATYLEQRFGELRSASDWGDYRPSIHIIAERGASFDDLLDDEANLRRPSHGAQPIFVDLFVTTVFMKGRAVSRRITERLVTAQVDGVEYYTARGFAAPRTDRRRSYVPVRALWGCRADFIEPSRPGLPAVTRLWFPQPLRRGQKAHFASEALFDEYSTEDRHWIDVDIDHHGIAKGRLLYGDRLPIRGLTIRVRFDEANLPEAVWWYAELNERERYDRPPPGDHRLLTLVGNDVQHTFTERVCQPRESYGLAFSWDPG
jgi:hypothetical protein